MGRLAEGDFGRWTGFAPDDSILASRAISIDSLSFSMRTSNMVGARASQISPHKRALILQNSNRHPSAMNRSDQIQPPAPQAVLC